MSIPVATIALCGIVNFALAAFFDRPHEEKVHSYLSAIFLMLTAATIKIGT